MEGKRPKKDDYVPLDEWAKTLKVSSTAEIDVPPQLADQVIGQDDAVVVIKKAAEQKRHVMLIGDPGTGKSMLGRAMTEFLPPEELEDVLVYNNQEDEHQPQIRVVPGGKGKEIVDGQKMEVNQRKQQRATMLLMISLVIIGIAVAFVFITGEFMALFYGLIFAAILFFGMRYFFQKQDNFIIPKLLVSHSQKKEAPFIDATGAHAGSLLGDVRHDPYQSGGLGTPAHERVESGAIHKAHKGILFIDEINLLQLRSQQSLLTAMQEKEYSIMGQSERSSGSLVKTDPVPCDFILIAAGNLDAIQGMHPALRSRIRGYGYEVFMKNTMPDTVKNRRKLVRFVAQEVIKDGKIPHFRTEAVVEVIREAQRRAGVKGKLSLRLRELGGLVRVAGDIAHETRSPLVTTDHVMRAKKMARSLEQQVQERMIETVKEYRKVKISGGAVGMVNGLAVQNPQTGMAEFSGLVLPIAAEVTPALSTSEGKVIATGKLGEIAKESVQNVSALIKKITGKDISNQDIHIQFVGQPEGVDGDSASVSIATAVISAIEGIEVDQSVAMTGSISVRGDVLPVGGVTAKIEAAAEIGIKKVLIPKANMRDVLLESRYKSMVEVVPVETLREVLDQALTGPKKANFISRLTQMVTGGNVIDKVVKDVPPHGA